MSTPGPESVSFDRAASYYDATRTQPAEVAQAETRLLLDEIGDPAGPVVEIGVGTGRIAEPLAGRHRVVGVDLSEAMLRMLVGKASGVYAVRGDTVRLPLPTASVGAVIACHVLHLVRDWRRAVEEVERVLVPGGVLLVSRGRSRDGLAFELQERIRNAAGSVETIIGLDDPADLDAYLGERGWGVRPAAPIPNVGSISVADFLDLIASNRASWTWAMSDEQRLSAVRQVRAWVAEEYGDPAHTTLPAMPIRWHTYRRP